MHRKEMKKKNTKNMNDIFNNPQYFEDGEEEVSPINLDMLRIMCKQYTNDADLGKIIRNLVKQLQNV